MFHICLGSKSALANLLMTLVIRQDLDAARLDDLSDHALEAADEAGELDGNHHYIDLSTATWSDVAYALAEEERLIRELEDAADPGDLEASLCEARDLEDEREALWHLDVGVASPVMALNAVGAHTALSCNGGVFGGKHLRDCPSIRFYPRHAPLDGLLEAARASGVGLIEEEGRALLYAGSVQDLQRFARELLARFGD
jgi:hypothetical protein